MKDHQMAAKLAPLLALEKVDEVILIRRWAINQSGLKQLCPPPYLKDHWLPLAELWRLVTLFRLCTARPKPDLIIGIQMIPHGIYAWLAGRIFSIRVIQLLVGDDVNICIRHSRLRRILESAQRIAVRGKTSRTKLLKSGLTENKIFMPQNVFDVDKFPCEKESKKEYDLVYVGELIERKQPGFLVEAVRILKPRYPDIKLLLVGDGPLRQSLELQCEKDDVMENVVFTGAVPPAKIPDFLNASKVFVMASRAEGLPNSMIEAMSCGLPVIVPNVDDVTSLAIHEKNALVLEKVTPENIAEAVCRLIQDKRLFQNLQKGVTDTREQLRKECSLDAVKKIWAEALDLTETEEQFSS